MKRSLAIILAALMVCAVFATAVWADDKEPVEGWGDEPEIIWEEAEGLQNVGDINGDFYRYVGETEKYYYHLYISVEARVEDGILHIYGADNEELSLCDEFDLTKHQWIQEIIDAYDGDVEIPMHHVDIAGIFEPVVVVEYEGTVTVVAPQEGLTAPENGEEIPAEGCAEEEPEIVDLTPEEDFNPDGVVETFEVTVYSDEYGDYVVYISNGDKRYIRLNPETGVAVDENGFVYAYDADGNLLDFEIEIDESKHPWIMELIKEHDASLSAPDDITYEDSGVAPTEGAELPNPNTGVAFAMTPAILAALTLIFKKR